MPQDSVVFGHIRQESEALIKAVCAKIFQNKDYNQAIVPTMISQTNEESIKQLLVNNKNFKYMVVTSVMQKRSASADNMEMTADCYWNASTDGQTYVKYENDFLYVLVTLFACAL